MKMDFPLHTAGPSSASMPSRTIMFSIACRSADGEQSIVETGLEKALFTVLFQAHRSGSDVPAFFERFARSSRSQICQIEAVRCRANDIAGRNLNRLLTLEDPQRFVDDRERKPDMSSDIHAQQASVQVDLFQSKFTDLHQGQAALTKCLRTPRGRNVRNAVRTVLC